MTRSNVRRLVAPVLVAFLAMGTTGCRIMPGTTYTGDGTYYGGDGSGNCSFPAGITMYAAMNDLDYEGARVCGGYVRATGPDGTVTVKIVDRCPECQPGDIDFSPEAFAQIADPIDGRVPISWELVSGAAIGNLAYELKDGSNQWWLAIQPRNHRNIVTSLEILVGGTWQAVPRESYNYFVLSSGAGTGPFTVRATDVHGEQIVTSGITLSPGVVQPTSSQFAAH